ncbi:MAG: SIS domain-containing protein [Candidatus Lokiarchaeota archaeon]|nr:SIS domain-containing protein [Candidatus Lokiarchaeota archaeon]
MNEANNVFLSEIFSQPEALKNTFEHILSECKPQFLQVKDFIKRGGISKLIFTGMGSSYIASYLPYYLLNQYGITIEIREAGEFLFNTFPKTRQDSFKDTGIVIISQSGESGEIRELLKNINDIDVKPLTIGITNNPDSYLAYMTELQIFMNIEKEATVTSKTYLCTLLILYVLSKTIIGEFFTKEEYIQEVRTLIKEIEDLLNDKQKIKYIWEEMLPKFGKKIEFLEILARGSSMVTAHQAALNFKEIVKSYSEATSISTFRHGGIECLNDKSKLIILTSDDKNLEFNGNFIKKLTSEWTFGTLLHITNQKFNEELEKIHKNPNIILYKHNIKDPFLAPLFEIVILQLLFYKMAEYKGIVPGTFLYSQKITREL